MGAMLNSALAAISAAFMPMRDYRAPQQKTEPQPYKKPFGKTSGRQGSKQRADLDRLILDRSSSVRKLQRWARAGKVNLPESDRAANRHKVRRIENQRAINLAKLSSP